MWLHASPKTKNEMRSILGLQKSEAFLETEEDEIVSMLCQFPSLTLVLFLCILRLIGLLQLASDLAKPNNPRRSPKRP